MMFDSIVCYFSCSPKYSDICRIRRRIDICVAVDGAGGHYVCVCNESFARKQIIEFSLIVTVKIVFYFFYLDEYAE